MGGLEAKSVDGSWVLADPVPGDDYLFIHPITLFSSETNVA